MEKNKLKLIAIISKKRSGKDTIADFLIDTKSFKKYSFADPIKHGAMAMFGFTKEQMWGSEKDKETIDPRWGVSPRKMLQLIGTELFQFDIHKYMKDGEFPVGRGVWVHKFKIWVDEIKKDIELGDTTKSNIVIADCRFPHEAKVIKEMGGEIWRVVRPSLVSIDEHASEMEQESIVADVTIMNDGSLMDLYNKINLLVK